jgi:glutamyl-tRNA reductase
MSEILAVGVNYKGAPLAVREPLAFSPEQVPGALQALLDRSNGTGAVGEAAILSTCNRSEIYAVSSCPEAGLEHLVCFISSRVGIPVDKLRQHLYVYRGEHAAYHLMQVAAGLDSLVIGENEILGQVKTAAELARQAGASGPILSALFRYAIRAGKRARSETDINRTGLSVATVVVELAAEMFGSLSDRTALLIGAGKISSLTARALLKAGLRCILVANRTYERALKLAETLQGQAVHFDALDESLCKADIVICSTGAPHIVLHKSAVQTALSRRDSRLLLVADLAVPRDADPAIASLPGVHLADIDSLEALVQVRHPLTSAVRASVEAILSYEQEAFLAWRESHRCSPVIRALLEKADLICREQTKLTLNKMGDLSPDQQQAVVALGLSIVAKLLHDPLASLRQPPEDLSAVEWAEMVAKLFGIEINPS